MPFIKKLVLHNFKSFAREVEIPFINSTNIIVGPNGSGKSNVTDAICFVLGRLDIKNMRAAKSANLIFLGSKEIKPAHEASVKLIFDNSDGSFPFQQNEISIERTVRRNGQSIYRINDQTKTRQETLELLTQAGIDPYGFNIILQGGIQGIVKMHPEDRRKIIEEVAGISVYEDKKEKSLHELEKTEINLKEVLAVLRERSIYMKNLEQERKQALRFKELEATVQKYKASILSKKINERKKEIEKLNESLGKQNNVKEGQRQKIDALQTEIKAREQEIEKINEIIYKSGGIEQDALHNQITELKAELAGLVVKKDGHEQRLSELLKKREQMTKDMKEAEVQLKKLREKSPILNEKTKELEQKKKALEELEKAKKEHFKTRNELELTKIRVLDKRNELKSKELENNSIMQELDALAKELSIKQLDSATEHLKKLKQKYDALLLQQDKNNAAIMKLEKECSALGSEISGLDDIKKKVTQFDICPLCKSKMTAEHIKQVTLECNEKSSLLDKKIDENTSQIEKLQVNTELDKKEITNLAADTAKINVEIIKLQNGEKRKERIKQLHHDSQVLQTEIQELDKKRLIFEKKFEETKGIDEKYDILLQDIKELSARTEENADVYTITNQRDIERSQIIIKQSYRDEEELKDGIIELQAIITERNTDLKEKEKAERELVEKFKKLMEKRDMLVGEITSHNTSVLEVRHAIEMLDSQLNQQKVDVARINSEIEVMDSDFKQYQNIEIVQASFEALQYKLENAQNALNSITSMGVNMRALEIYDTLKAEYDEVSKKAEQLFKEKEEILKIITEIDKKKKRSFMKTLSEVNQSFTENFQRLSTKGVAYLELENTEDPFAGGLTIVDRIAKGKYFDVTSLSGGEQTLVALSLLFAIQKYRPYPFYIFDEIDAALDKRNSERLAVLIQQNFGKHQHIIITHNDALMQSAPVLYGVSMQDGISKLISIEL
jgi:chromosome segregation protein